MTRCTAHYSRGFRAVSSKADSMVWRLLRSTSMNMTSLLVGAGAGAGLMYLLDPAQGNRRRALMRDQLIRARHLTGDAMDATSRDVRNRARGVVAELRSRLIPDDVSDDVLQERVRARLGQIVRYARSIEATVQNGRVTLRGPVLADDIARLMRRVGQVPGVREVDSQLDVHATPGTVPGLQGMSASPSGGEVLDFVQSRFSPGARLATALGGALLALWGVRRLDAAGVPVATIGMALLARGAGNPAFADLFDNVRRAVSRR
jgi:BON domain